MSQTRTRIRVFRLNDCDWFAGEDLESCIKGFFADYLGETDTPKNREEYLDEPNELSDEELDRLKFTDIEGEWGKQGQQYTFRKALENMIKGEVEFPVLFASTEF